MCWTASIYCTRDEGYEDKLETGLAVRTMVFSAQVILTMLVVYWFSFCILRSISRGAYMDCLRGNRSRLLC